MTEKNTRDQVVTMEQSTGHVVLSALLLFTSAGLSSSQQTGFQCTAAGTFADPKDCHGFYSCDASLTPTKASCTEYGRFDPVENNCVWESCTNPTDPSVTTAPPSGGGFNCPGEGYFANPSDCHTYYSCDQNLTPAKSSCTLLGYFDTATQQCLLGSCSDVTTSSPTSNPGGTTQPTTGVFQCTSSGYYADPKNCRGFYLCSPALVPSHGICMGGGGRFNPTLGGCEIGSC